MDRLRPAILTPSGRLRLGALDRDQLAALIAGLPALENRLGLRLSRAMLADPVPRAIRMKLEKMAAAPGSDHIWYTYWLIVVRADQAGVGLAGFKGAPDQGGAVEIGYGIDPAYQGRGYMTEAVGALVGWALRQPVCRVVTATTVRNPASVRVLEKAGFTCVGGESGSTNWLISR
jgi:RimJ/RimL family protein N-acetyltransferase